MADGMEVDPKATRANAPKFDQAAQALDKALAELDQVLTAEGTCWGADDPGTEFDGKYVASKDDAKEGFAKISEKLTETTKKLQETADTWESIDANAAGNINEAGSWT